jgi:tight adherence protein C
MSGLSVEQLLPFAIFGLVTIFGIWLTSFLSGGTTRAMERLDEFKNPALRRDKDKDPKTSDAMTKMLEKATPAFAKPLQPKSEYEVSKLKGRLSAGGFRGESAVSVFLGLKFIGLMAGLVLGGGVSLFLSGVTQRTLFTAILSSGFAFYLPDIILWIAASSRKEKLFLSLPDALDLLVVCVEAGLGLDQAMRKVADEMKQTYPVVSYEFSLANFQLQVGRARHEVLHELGARNGVDDLRSLASI